MADCEVIVVSNVERFSLYSGYLQSFTYSGPTSNVFTAITADAVFQDHFTAKANSRDVAKAVLAFRGFQQVSSGAWGCGMFGGDIEHKALQQIIAARLARLDVLHLSFLNKEDCQRVQLLECMCNDYTCNELLDLLTSYCAQREAGSVQTVVAFFAQRGQKLAILLIHGSFNPVTKYHIALMEEAKRRAENAGYVVPFGFMCPTSADWIRAKEATCIQLETRLEALETASTSWIYIEERGVEVSSGATALRRFAIPQVCRILDVSEEELYFLTVSGEDASRPKASNPPGVFIARGTASGLKQRVSDVNQERSQSGKKPHLYGEAVGDGSSTLVRTALENNQYDEVERLCGVAVMELLRKKAETNLLWEKEKDEGCVVG